MTAPDVISEHFPELRLKISTQRQSDPLLDEICRDFEELMMVVETSVPDTGDNDDTLQADLSATIQALGEEIRVRLRTNCPDESRK